MLILADPHSVRHKPKQRRPRKPAAAPRAPLPEPRARSQQSVIASGLAVLFLGLSAQLVKLANIAASTVTAAISDPVATTVSRPDIVDRNGRLLATDVEVHSLYADPFRVLDRDESLEKLTLVLPDLDTTELSRALSDKTKRFVWIHSPGGGTQRSRTHHAV